MYGSHIFLAGLPGGWELFVIILALLLLFGRRIPGVARSLGQGISSFKKGLSDPLDEEKSEKKIEQGSSSES